MDPTPADRVPSNTIMRSQVRARAAFLKPGRCHPLLALFVLATFLLSLAPRRARAEDPKQVVEIPKEQIETPAPEQPATVPEQQVMSLPTGEDKSGVTSQAISVPKGPGTIQGMGESFSAQPSTGIATFSVPFALPKARGAVQPSLSLGYSSSSGRGIAGLGWDAYDASDARVRKTVVAPDEDTRHTLYIFNSLELRLAWYLGGQYTVNASTEVPYLFAHGVRLARVVHTVAPYFTSPSTRVYLELGDHLGSTSVVLDRATGELVERSTAYAYGGAESAYRPGRWESFREDYRFTGKEDDIEVGLIYFGARYLSPQLGRWISADPLGVHAPGKADSNLYAYVHGKVLVAVDPVGLDLTSFVGGLVSEAWEKTKAAASAEYQKATTHPVSWVIEKEANAIPAVMIYKAGSGVIKGLSDFPEDFADAVAAANDEEGGRKALKPVLTAMSFTATVAGAKDLVVLPGPKVPVSAPKAKPKKLSPKASTVKSEAVPAPTPASAGASKISPLSGIIDVGGDSATRSNINPGWHDLYGGQPPDTIPNNVVAPGETMAEHFKAGSARLVMSENLPYAGPNREQMARGAMTVLEPGGQVAMNAYVWGTEGDVAAASARLTRAFSAAGFQDVSVTRVGETGLMVNATKK